MSQPLAPGAMLGVLGGGQLGRMFALAARRMGYRVAVLVPEEESPTGQIADLEMHADYDDLDAVAHFAQQVAVVTFEFENVSSAATETAARFAPVHPGGHVLHTTQHRAREKQFVRSAGVPVTPFAIVNDEAELTAALTTIGLPAVLKTASWGYDGKGQVMLRRAEDAPAAWERIGKQQAVLEAFIDFDRELSVVGVRGQDGSFTAIGPLDNVHVNHILDLTTCPTTLPAQTAQQAVEITRTLMEKLEVVGVLCVEFFHSPSKGLMVNELAPRPHNSGHLSIEAHVTSQFEQQVRAICGLPLGDATQLRPAAMVNLLGDVWQHGEPNWAGLAAMNDVKLHLYGKLQARAGRKMGHLTVLGEDAQQAGARALAARDVLRRARE